MAQVDVVMPQWGMSMIEGTIIEWLVEVGDEVQEDQALAQVEAAKVEDELVAPASGRITEILVPPSETVPVRTVLARIESDDA
jgi:pyruvate/2-oxoglutarate dehydrogenase complex dihydrolipoamide acyltransferase (E2) component